MGAETTTTSTNGAEIFAGTCSSCHGATGMGSLRGPSLVGIGQFFATDRSPLINQVAGGGVNMPSFTGKLTPVQIEAVVGYVVETFR